MAQLVTSCTVCKVEVASTDILYCYAVKGTVSQDKNIFEVFVCLNLYFL
jgi:hypothetical protein